MSDRFCVDCKHVEQIVTSYFCKHPQVLQVNLVTGNKYGMDCHKQRATGYCGFYGLNWEPAEQ